MRMLVHFVFAALYLLVAFFGIGPVLMADGSQVERLWTLIVVLAVFVVLISAHTWLTRRTSRQRPN
ncbi:hypothetical protein SD71_00485 [Cohnella kolymensis]|uniref:Uncharacterized protein n=1 Tax=Cohnella kolymensis TaxID=1590652 RepID=A0ABR5A8D5_9BACL|nr:hypothetical protein [Cohnella kolymensis]KIL37235.1 hypothetical protein SD71_00485 [Cohnella kolymensis]